MGRILVIEDDPGNQLLYQSRLKDLGHEVVIAETGAVGISEARSGVFDLYFVDMHLGEGVDGIEVCRRLKRDPDTRNVPVVLISTKIRSREDQHRGYEAGCEAFLIKNDSILVEDVVRAMLRIKALQDELASQMSLFKQRNERLQQALQDKAALEDQLKKTSPSSPAVLPQLMVPDAVLLVDPEGTVVSADRGAHEVFGKRLEGKSLGGLAPGTRLEAFVRDTRQVSHTGFRFTVPARGSRIALDLVACTFPFVPPNDGSDSVLRIVLVYDAGRHGRVWERAEAAAGGTTLPEVTALTEIACREFTPARILGDSPEIAQARAKVQALCSSTEHVLLEGEAGTGKGIVARTLHFAGHRTGAFIPMGCGDASRESVDSLLLGDEDRPGLLQRADGGTLFLEDVDRLSLALQRRIADVLREGLAGSGKKKRRLDLRVVAATARDLGPNDLDPEFLEVVAQNRIELPPLRRRMGDLRILTDALRFRFGGTQSEFSEACRVAFECYDWPGNEQELEAVVEHAFASAGSSGRIDIEHLPPPLPDVYERAYLKGQVTPTQPPTEMIPGTHRASAPPAAPEGVRDVLEDLLAALPELGGDGIPISFEFFEKWALIFALSRTEGDKLKAARLLSVGKSTLYRKLNKYEI